MLGAQDASPVPVLLEFAEQPRQAPGDLGTVTANPSAVHLQSTWRASCSTDTSQSIQCLGKAWQSWEEGAALFWRCVGSVAAPGP